MQLTGQNLHNEHAYYGMREDTNFKGSDLSCPSIYFLLYGSSIVNRIIHGLEAYLQNNRTHDYLCYCPGVGCIKGV